MKDFAIQSLEKSINHYINLDPNATLKVQALSNNILKLCIKPVVLYFHFHEKHIQIKADNNDDNVTATIEGYPLAFLQLAFLDKKKVPQLFKQDLSISGDIAFGQNVRDLFQNIDIDWEEHISSFTGDIIAHELANIFSHSKKFTHNMLTSMQKNITEYLQEETAHLPCREEIDDFCQDIDHLKLRVDRLQAKLKEDS